MRHLKAAVKLRLEAAQELEQACKSTSGVIRGLREVYHELPASAQDLMRLAANLDEMERVK